MQPISVSGDLDTHRSAYGFCEACGTEHHLSRGYAQQAAADLIARMDAEKRIDFTVEKKVADPHFSTEYLFGNARGQMFGVLVGRDAQGDTWVIKAFSGQYNGMWAVDGWVPPLVDYKKVDNMSFGVERLIKKMGQRIDALPHGDPEREALLKKRKALSQALMQDIHGLYQVSNFCGQSTSLKDAALGDGGLPTGTGDCCAPKLLGYAARHGLTPLGLVEFYYGAENKSGTRKHGHFYESCEHKCSRILGYMLCGVPSV